MPAAADVLCQMAAYLSRGIINWWDKEAQSLSK